MMDLSNPKIPTDVAETVAAQQHEIDDTKKECNIMKNFINNVIAAAMASPKKNSAETDGTESESPSEDSQSSYSSCSCATPTQKTVKAADWQVIVQTEASEDAVSNTPTIDSSATELPSDNWHWTFE